MAANSTEQNLNTKMFTITIGDQQYKMKLSNVLPRGTMAYQAHAYIVPIGKADPQTDIQLQLQEAIAERDALLELKRQRYLRIEAEKKAELAKMRSKDKALELANAKKMLEREKAIQQIMEDDPLPYVHRNPEVEKAKNRNAAIAKLNREKESTDANADVREICRQKAAELQAAKAELARLKAIKAARQANETRHNADVLTQTLTTPENPSFTSSEITDAPTKLVRQKSQRNTSQKPIVSQKPMVQRWIDDNVGFTATVSHNTSRRKIKFDDEQQNKKTHSYNLRSRK